jgi:Tol biopolymer transport system component
VIDVRSSNIYHVTKEVPLNTEKTHSFSNVSWSPSSNKLAFSSYQALNSPISEAYVVDADGRNLSWISGPEEGLSSLEWSPNGSKVLYTNKSDEDYELYSANSDGTDKHQLTQNTTSDHSATWSPDGRRISYVTVTEGKYYE